MPVINSATNCRVSEEGLTNGLADTAGSNDAVNTVSASGTINITDVDSSALTVALSGPAGLTSGGAPVNWSWDASSQTLTGFTGTIGGANYAQVMTVVLSAPVSGSSDWTYNLVLTAPLDHPNTNSEDELPINIGITVTDDKGGSTTGSFAVTVEDDSPVDQVDESLTPELTNGSGSVTGNLFAPGADGIGHITFAIETPGILYQGQALNYTMSGMTLNAWADINNDGDFDPNETVFTLTAIKDAGGNYDYQLNLIKEIQLDKSVIAQFSTAPAGANNAYYVLNDGTFATKGPAASDTLITITGNDKVNSNSFGIGVGGPSIGASEYINFNYGSGTNAATIALKTGVNGTPSDSTVISYIITYANGTTETKTATINGTLEIQQLAPNGTDITNIKISYVSGAEFQVSGVASNTIVVEDPIDIEFSYTATDKDGDKVVFDSNSGDGHVSVTINPSLAPLANTPLAQALLREDDIQGPSGDIDSKTLSFTAGQNEINLFKFADVNAISVQGINAQIHWALNAQGELIGTVFGREALRLSLDWEAINAGEQGNISVKAELLTTLPHSVGQDNLVIDGIKVVAVDASGKTAESIVTVTVEDAEPEATNDTNNVDVVVDSFKFSGVAAEWKNIQGGTNINKFDSNDNDTALDQVRWGKPSASNGQQSGYGFIDNDAALSGALPLNQEIVLGTFTHYNFPINSGTSIKAATMEVNFSVTDAYGKTTPVTLALNFSHNETSNSGADPRDIVTVGQTNVTFNYEGQVYTLQVIGFKDANGNVVSSIYTNENAATSYQLVVRMVAGNGYTLPNTQGDVLKNDNIGADSALQIIGVAKGDVTNIGAFGQVGAVITGLYGTLVLNANGEYQYQVTKNANEIGSGAVDTFTYTIRDGDGDTSSATLKINVNAVNANGAPLVEMQNVIAQMSVLDDDQVNSSANGDSIREISEKDSNGDNHWLRGGESSDTLISGLGDNMLRGEGGSDTFVWRYADADKGTDHIVDFNVREDKLDLSDLLQGETADTLENYLFFSLDKGSTIIDIDANKDGVFDQHIVLDGVDLYSQYGVADNAGIINGLLGSNGNGPLIIDTQPVTPEPSPGMPPLEHELNKIP